MKKFRQKNFIAPLIGMAGKAAVSMAPDLIGAGAQAFEIKQNANLQKEALEKQEKLQKEQNKILNKAVNKNPGAVASTIQQQQSQSQQQPTTQPQQNQFSYIGNLGRKYKDQAKNLIGDLRTDLKGVGISDVTGFGKDIKHSLSKNKDIMIKGALITGAAMAGSYVGNKAVKLYKDKKFKERMKEWEEEERDYSIKDSVKNALKKTAKDVGRVAWNNKGRLGLTFAGTALAAAAPFAISEYTKRQMAKNTEYDDDDLEEREYSFKFDKKNMFVKGFRNVKAGVIKKYRTVKEDPVRTLLRAVSPIRRGEINKVAGDLEEGESGSKITKAVVNTLKNHPKTSLIVGGLVAGGIRKGIRKVKNKAYEGVKKVDPTAFSQESYYDYLDNED